MLRAREGNPDDMLTLDEVLKELHVDKKTFYRICNRGDCGKVVHGGRVMVKRQWIWDYWEKINHEAERKRNERARRHRSKRRTQNAVAEGQ